MTVRLIALDLLDPCRFQRPYHADEENIEAIRADLEENGGLLLNPIHALPTDDGRWEILAGHDRAEAAKRAGLEEVGVRSFHGVVATDEEVWCHWKRENDLRKTPDRRRDVEETLARFTEWSDRRIASVCGVSPTTVGKVRAELEDAGTVSSVDTREGVDGVEQPARKPTPKVPPTAQDTPRRSEPGVEPIPKVQRHKPMEYDKFAPMEESRAAMAERVESGSEDDAVETPTAPDGGPIAPAEVVAESQREFRESGTGKVGAYLQRIGIAPEFTDAEIAEAVSGFGDGEKGAEFRKCIEHRDLLERVIRAHQRRNVHVVR